MTLHESLCLWVEIHSKAIVFNSFNSFNSKKTPKNSIAKLLTPKLAKVELFITSDDDTAILRNIDS